MGDWNLDAIADRLQEAALDPTLWPDVLTELSETVGAAGAILLATEKRLPGPPSSPDMADLVRDYFGNGWNLRDERYRGVPKMMQKGVMVDQDFTSPEEMQSSAYYQEFLGRHGRRGFAGIGFKAGGDLWCVAIQRTIRQGLFEPNEQSRLASLWRPLSDAAALSRQIGFARVQGISDALELTNQPAIVLDDRGRVLRFNALAERHFGDVIEVAGRTLVFRDAQSRKNFDSLFACVAGELVISPTEPAVTFVRDLRGRPIVIRAIALRGWARFTFTNARVLLLLGLRGAQRSDGLSVLTAAYGFTPAEARLATELRQGTSLSEAAAKVGTTYETARSNLKSIFGKTNVHRQGQLIALLESMFPAD